MATFGAAVPDLHSNEVQAGLEFICESLFGLPDSALIYNSFTPLSGS